MAKDVDTMAVVRQLYKDSGLTLQELGEKMGFEPPTARQAAHQFLRVSDPRLSTIKRFAKAVGVPLRKLVGD